MFGKGRNIVTRISFLCCARSSLALFLCELCALCGYILYQPALSGIISMAWQGHCSWQVPQPVHRL